MASHTMVSGLVAAILLGTPSVSCLAQTATVAQTPVTAEISFSVISVKENKSNAAPKINIPPGPGDAYVPTAGLYSATNMPLIIYMMFAYNLMGSQMQPLLHQMPDWVTTDRFDIQAQSEDPNPTKDQMRLMLQSLLADRFQMVVHKEMQQAPVFGMVVAKRGILGPWLKRHSTDVPCSPAPSGAPAGASSQTVVGGFPITCGAIASVLTTGLGRYAFGARDVSLPIVANILGAMPELGRPVLDQTGLAGTFDFRMEFTPQNNEATAANLSLPTASLSLPSGTTLLEAITEQLGLKLVPQKGSVEGFVVDHVAYPSAN